MAPNSEEDASVAFQNKRSWDFADKEPLRPPVYNPEDYAASLKKWGRKPNSGMQLPLYLSQSTGSIDKISAEISLQDKKQSSLSTKSSSSIKSGEEKHSKKDKELTLKVEKKDLKNKENINRGMKNEILKEFRNPILTLTSQEGEMSLRQFSSVTELLSKLKIDLKLSFPSFVQEFVGDPVDGVTLLLELLRAVQLSQASLQQKCPPQVLRRALLDEHSCLVCLKHCLRCSDASRRLASSSAGLFTLAVCIMNNVTRTRIIALELLTKACEPPANGHKVVSEALSTLRLRFGEPVRFRFLVGMLNSAGSVELLATAMRFINVFVETAPRIQQKIYIQAELEQAGFDSKILKRTLPTNSEPVKVELNKWEKNYFDVEVLQSNASEIETLQEKIQILEKRIEILQEEKGILQSLERCLKERCSELEEEVSIKTATTAKSPPMKKFRTYNLQENKKSAEKEESTPAEDEGISSSEQELSQDEDYVKEAISYSNSNDFEKVTKYEDCRTSPSESRKSCNQTTEKTVANNFNIKNLRNKATNKMKETNVDDGNEIIPTDYESNEEEETTIDEVIEELENIVNDAETEACKKEKKFQDLNSKITFKIPNFQKNPDAILQEKYMGLSKPTLERDSFEESEIIPSMLHPQPPRKSKSLVHIYFSGRDFDGNDNLKSEFFDEDTDSESSDSLLTATRDNKPLHKNCHKSLEVSDSFHSYSSVNTRTLFIKHEEEHEESEIDLKLGFEERNIDEEEKKRKHLKNQNLYLCDQVPSFPAQIIYKDRKLVEVVKKKINNYRQLNGSVEELNKMNFSTKYEKTTSFKEVKDCIAPKILDESPTSRIQKSAPTPVKRSQTFHITSSDGEFLYRRNDLRPKPKMGVSGLDFQRTAEQKGKNDHAKYQSIEYKKSLDKKPDANDRYTKKISKEIKKSDENQDGLQRRGSFDDLLSVKESKNYRTKFNKKPESPTPNGLQNSSYGADKLPSKLRSKSLEKMDDGLDSMVDIVIAPTETKKFKPKNEWNVEATKNIGPRTRRSLAESSLFIPQFPNKLIKSEVSPQPPKPAQRTSLARNNSSSVPLHLPIEIKLAPVLPKQQQQYVYNFGLKPVKSEDSLLSNSNDKPDGSSSSMDRKKNHQNESQKIEEKPPLCSTPSKQSKLQKFFGNPKFDNSTGIETNFHQKYFENNYASTSATNEKPVSPMPRSIQNLASNTTQKVKDLIPNSSSHKRSQNGFRAAGEKEHQLQSKPNFLLGTYQSQPSKNTSLKPIENTLVMNSINNFNNTFLPKQAVPSNKTFPNGRKNISDNNDSQLSNDKVLGNINSRHINNKCTVSSEKVTDSLSGLY